MVLVILSEAFFLVGVLLMLHHCWKHAQEDPETSHAQQESCPEACYLQPSDVMNFRTCNHEMWIIFCFSASWICYLWGMYVERNSA